MTNTFISPAKVNLTLWVTGQRDDGYHLLDSLVVFSDIADTVTLTLTDNPNTITLTVDGPYGESVPTDENNLILQAVRSLQAYAKETGQPLTHGVHIHLTKILPVSSGLGGGSSNCATLLNELPLLWGIAITQLDIDDIGQKLGADVMVCLRQATMRMQGIGEVLNPIALSKKKMGIVLVNPNVPLNTVDVFNHYQNQRKQGLLDYSVLDEHWDVSPLDTVATVLNGNNDLQGSAMDLCGDIAPVLQALSERDDVLCYGMSGSGATCFALFDDTTMAEKAKIALSSEYPDWWVNSGMIL